MFTHTFPAPPPGAGAVLATASAFVFAAAAAGLGEVFGLNKSANGFFDGEAEAAGDAAAVIAVFFRFVFAAGSTAGAVEAAGEVFAAVDAVGLAAAFFFFDFFAGDAEASAAGDSLAPGEASFAAFLRDFFAGEAEASGEPAADALAVGLGD